MRPLHTAHTGDKKNKINHDQNIQTAYFFFDIYYYHLALSTVSKWEGREKKITHGFWSKTIHHQALPERVAVPRPERDHWGPDPGPAVLHAAPRLQGGHPHHSRAGRGGGLGQGLQLGAVQGGGL